MGTPLPSRRNSSSQFVDEVLTDIAFWNQLLGFCTTRVGQLRAERIVEGIVLSLLRGKTSQFENADHARNHIWWLVRRRVYERRVRRSDRAYAALSDEDVPEDQFAEDAFERVDVDDLLAAIRQLDEESYDYLYLRFHQGLTLTQLGELWGISHQAADKRTKRALQKLREQLLLNGIEL